MVTTYFPSINLEDPIKLTINMLNSKLNLALILIASSFCLQTHESQSQENNLASNVESNGQQLKYISAGMNSTYEFMSSAKAKVSVYQLTPKGAFGNISNIETNYVGTWAVNKNLTSVSINIMDSKKKLINSSKRAKISAERLFSDGIVANSLRTTITSDGNTTPQQTRYDGVIQPSISVLSSVGVWQAFEDADPRNLLFFNGGTRLISSVILDPQASVQVQGEDDYEGSRCMKIQVIPKDTTGYDLYWIDVDHGFITRKVSVYRGNMKVIELNSSGLLESNGVWIPASLELKVGPALDDPSSIQVVRNLSFSEFQAGPNIDLGELKFQWPISTVINDIINQKTLIVAAVENSALSLYNHQRQISGKPEVTGELMAQDEINLLNKQRREENRKELQNAVKVIAEPQEVEKMEAYDESTQKPIDKDTEKK